MQGSTQSLFHRDNSHCQSVRRGEEAELKGPTRSISAAGGFTIDLLLKDYDLLSPDDEISKGQISWNAYDAFNEYNKIYNNSRHLNTIHNL